MEKKINKTKSIICFKVINACYCLKMFRKKLQFIYLTLILSLACILKRKYKHVHSDQVILVFCRLLRVLHASAALTSASIDTDSQIDTTESFMQQVSQRCTPLKPIFMCFSKKEKKRNWSAKANTYQTQTKALSPLL